MAILVGLGLASVGRPLSLDVGAWTWQGRVIEFQHRYDNVDKINHWSQVLARPEK